MNELLIAGAVCLAIFVVPATLMYGRDPNSVWSVPLVPSRCPLVLLAAIGLFGASASAGDRVGRRTDRAQYFIAAIGMEGMSAFWSACSRGAAGLAVISGVMWLRPRVEAIGTGERRALRQARNPRSRGSRARCFRPAARSDRARAQRARLGQAARRRRSQRRDLACRARQAAGAAQVRPAGGAEGARRSAAFQRDGARQGAAPADVAGADLRAGRRGQDWWGAARACSPPASAPATSCTTPSRITSRPAASSWSRRARARLRGDSAGIGNTEQQIEAIAHLKPAGYIGTPDFLKILLDAAAKPARTSRRSSAASSPARRCRLAAPGARRRGVKVLQCYATAELGVIAYESEALEGMIVNET